MASNLKHIKRSLQIARAFAKYRCYFFLKGTRLDKPARILGFILAPSQTSTSLIMSDGQKLTQIFQTLGPCFIKLGQSLSVRSDIIGDKLAEDLSKLQDKLPPFPTAEAKQIIETELGRNFNSIFSQFNEQPAAAASIAQVHFARDLEGNEVAVKILRPNIESKFFKDINLLHWLAKLINKKFPEYRRLKLNEVVNTLEITSIIEMDLQFEAASANELAENFKDDEDIRIPKIYWQNSSSRVMTLEKFVGIPIDETKRLQAAGLDLNNIIKKSANIFLKQTLRDGFFHADMHPGNVLVDNNGKICVYDFGIMGRIDRKTRIFMAEMLLGFLNRDYQKVADIHFEAGYIPQNQSRELFAQACRAIGEPIFGLPQSHISIATLLQKLFKVTERFQMETQPQLLLLQKTMMMAEGIARKLDPQVNFWELSKDLIEDWGKENLGPKAKIEEKYKQAINALKNFGEAITNLNQVITPKGIVLHPDTINSMVKSFRLEKKENNFMKGFITAIFLAIITLITIYNL